MTVTPNAGTNLNIALSTTGDFIVNTDDLVVDTSAGNVGIGTVGPLVPLHVVSDSSTNVLQLEENLGGEYINFNIDSSGDFFIRTDGGREAFRINNSDDSRDGFVAIGGDDDYPNAFLHIARDQDNFTELRIDNSNDGTSIEHMGLTLYDGSDFEAFFRHNNSTDILSLGHNAATGQVAIYSGGAEQIRIDSSGEVGIGTTTPDGLLDVEGGGIYISEIDAPGTPATAKGVVYAKTDGKIYFKNDAGTETDLTAGGAGGWIDDGTTVRLTTSTDDVGIGTTTPDGTLHVHTATAGTVTANTGYDDLVVENSDNGGITVLVPDASYAGISFGSPSDSFGAILSWSHNDDLFSLKTFNAGADMRFSTDNNVEAMRILDNGNVGIGTPSPSKTLHVVGTVRLENVNDGFVESDASGNLSTRKILVGTVHVGDIGWDMGARTVAGDITSASLTRVLLISSTITVNFPAMADAGYVVNMTVEGTEGTKDVDNDLEEPIIYGKENDHFYVYLDETSLTNQDITLNFIIMDY